MNTYQQLFASTLCCKLVLFEGVCLTHVIRAAGPATALADAASAEDVGDEFIFLQVR